MKTQILQLEAHDDVISILDKIGWAQTERVLLVLPRRRRILHQKLDLLRLSRHCQKRGCQLALVTDDPLIKALAGEIHVPTFRTIQKAHQANWQTERFEQSWVAFQRDLPKRSLTSQIEATEAARSSEFTRPLPIWARVGWFLLGIFAVAGLLAVLSPSATIVIHPQTKSQTMVVEMKATHRVAQVRISGEVPISVRSVLVEGEKTILVSGTTTLPKDFAKGEVILTNLTDQPIEVPAGTLVRTLDPKPRRYATQKTVLLKTGSEKRESVPVQALEAGESQNAKPLEIKAVEGMLGLKVSVENPQSIAGGNSMIAPAPSESDRRSLFNQLQAELLEKAKEKVSQEIQAGDILLPDSAIQTLVTRQKYTPDERIAANFLSLDLGLEVSFGIVTKQSLADLGKQLLASSLPPQYIPLEDTLSAKCLEEISQTPDGEYTCKLEISRQIQPHIDHDQVRSLVLGKPITVASQILRETFPLSTAPKMKILPRWLPFLPWLPMRIDVLLET
ncbi:MAG: hypothetical protein N3D16_00655 [Anaerolineales bacterium]|nr:hypothetical protein [Anaerolineales bacterium]